MRSMSASCIEFTALLRSSVWMASGAAEAAGAPPRSWLGLLGWSLSNDLFARAIRMAGRDYLLRRFGRLNGRDEAILRARTAR